MHGLDLGHNRANKQLAFYSQEQPIVVIGNPGDGALKFSMWFELVPLIHPLQLQLTFDGIVGAGPHFDPLSPDYFDTGDVSRIRGINRDAEKASIAQRLAAQIKQRGMQVIEILQSEIFNSWLRPIAFCSCARNALIGKFETGFDPFRADVFQLMDFQWAECV
jgi:hypothetical protein